MPDPDESQESPHPKFKIKWRGGGARHIKGSVFDVHDSELDVEGAEFEDVGQMVTGRNIKASFRGNRVVNPDAPEEAESRPTSRKSWVFPEMPWKRKKRPKDA